MATTNKAKLPIGFVIADKYRITGELGRGGMAAVYEAENIDIGKRVAIKVLAQELISSSVVVERFLREARAVAAIRSPYICDVYDSGRLEDGRPFIVLELLEGESLYERMVRLGQVDIATTVAVITQTCKGLIKAHAAGIVHRDLKPENIFITRDEEGRVLAKVLDFGLAKFYAPLEGDEHQARLTREGAVFGTPAYMSPEQVRGQGAVDARADLWALACITYESLTGRTVWSTEQGVAMTFAQIANAPLPDPLTIRADLPESFRTWFMTALDREISKRYQTPKEFAEELLRAMEMGPMSYATLESSELSELRRPTDQDGPASTPSGRDRGPSTSTPTAGVAAPAPIRGSRAHFASPDVPKAEGPQSAMPPAHELGKSRSGLWTLLIMGALGGAGYGAYRVWVPPTGPTTVSSAIVDAGAPSSSTPSAPSSAPTVSANEGLPFRPIVAKAQDKIAQNDLEGAAKLMKEARELGGHGITVNMTEHIAQAIDGKAAGAPCVMTGLGRPRFDDLLGDKVRASNASIPFIALGSAGPVVVWIEERAGQQQAYSVALDDSLRAKSVPAPITPEGQEIGRPQLLWTGEKFLVSYYESRGTEAGAYVRYLDADGRISSASVKIGSAIGGAYFPSVTSLPDNQGFAVGWVSLTERATEDLFLRKLYPTLEPASDTTRVTALRPNPIPSSKTRVRAPVLSLDPSGGVRVAFRLDREPERLFQQLRIPVPDLTKGVDVSRIGKTSPDAGVGEMKPLKTRGKVDAFDMRCAEGGCYVVWNEDQGEGLLAAFLEPGKIGELWHASISRTGSHPAVAIGPDGAAQLAWYEPSAKLDAIAMVSISRDAPNPNQLKRGISRLARVASKDLPPPSMTRGQKPGEWYVAWQDSEAGHMEVYVARAQCK